MTAPLRPRPVRLTLSPSRRDALDRAYRWSKQQKQPCYILRKRTGRSALHLAHPWPIPDGWTVSAVVIAGPVGPSA